MNLLIVDDEISAIRAVSGMLDLPALGIDEYFTALSAQEARACIRANTVDLLLCDIEMPQESGLDLLEWIQQNGLDISCIYMTCYAEFSYAQRAIKLGSSSYLLKPIDPEELTQAITAEIKKRTEREQLKTAHRSLLSNQENICHQFWRNLFYEEIPSDREAIRAQLAEQLLPLDADVLYCPALVVVRNWWQELEADHRLNRYGVHNAVTELFGGCAEQAGLWWTVFPFGQHGQMTICGGGSAEQLAACARAFAEEYLQKEAQYLRVSSVCYLGRCVPIERMAEEMEWLMRMDNNGLANKGIAVHDELRGAADAGTDFDEQFRRWGGLLDGGFFEKAEQEITAYLHRQEGQAWFNKRRFRYFLGHYAGMLTAYAERHNFALNRLTANAEAAKCFETSDRGIDHMCAWVQCSLRQLAHIGSSDDPVAATKSYIEAHLAEELEMPQIAENVHLNQDYLTRIFKRETGLSVKGYLVARRMEKAKTLLETSRLPIADVAYRVGYDNYTSFNRIFKKYCGVSPQGYRRSRGEF